MTRSLGKVLIVDDESSIRRALHGTLEGMGFNVKDACTGEEAVHLVRDAEYDVVLLDINMPGMGGIKACREIRRSLPRLGILMLTVRDSEEDKSWRLMPARTITSQSRSTFASWRRASGPQCGVHPLPMLILKR